jgi:hypothetical protein
MEVRSTATSSPSRCPADSFSRRSKCSLDNSFYAIAAGTSINDTDPLTHLGNALIGGPGEYLDDLADGPEFGGTGLASPVGPGTYTIWFQDAAVERNYQMAYTVVPEPSVAATLSGGAGLLCGLRRRRRR